MRRDQITADSHLDGTRPLLILVSDIYYFHHGLLWLLALLIVTNLDEARRSCVHFTASTVGVREGARSYEQLQ